MQHNRRTVNLTETLYAIQYHFYNLKNVKNTHVEVILLEKLQATALLKVTLLRTTPHSEVLLQ